jgi:hypothetical protein
MQTKQRGDASLAEQLQERFNIASWEWPRLKVLYEATLAGDTFAEKLIADVEADQTTVSAAYSDLRQHHAVQAEAMNLPSTVRLPMVYEKALRLAGFAETTNMALRHNVRVTAAGMSDKDIADCIQTLRAAGANLKQAADHLSRSKIGGDSRNGRSH